MYFTLHKRFLKALLWRLFKAVFNWVFGSHFNRLFNSRFLCSSNNTYFDGFHDTEFKRFDWVSKNPVLFKYVWNRLEKNLVFRSKRSYLRTFFQLKLKFLLCKKKVKNILFFFLLKRKDKNTQSYDYKHIYICTYKGKFKNTKSHICAQFLLIILTSYEQNSCTNVAIGILVLAHMLLKWLNTYYNVQFLCYKKKLKNILKLNVINPPGVLMIGLLLLLLIHFLLLLLLFLLLLMMIRFDKLAVVVSSLKIKLNKNL